MPRPPPDCRPGDPTQTTEEAIEALKARSSLQLVFAAARLLNEFALASAPRTANVGSIRAAHLALFAHIPWEGAHVTAIAERAGISKQAVSQLLGDLEQAGVVERRTDPDDRRARLVLFTEAGKQYILGGLQHLLAVEDTLDSALEQGKLAHLRPILSELVRWLEQRRDSRAD